MKARILGRLALAICLLGMLATAGAGVPVVNEDIDLFLGATPPNAGCGCANVLMIIDNSSTWGSNSFVINDGTKNTPLYFTQQAMNSVITNVGSSIQLGMMLSQNNGNDPIFGTNGGALGGVVRFALRPMTTANKTSFITMVDGLDSGSDEAGPAASPALDMHTAYEYFTGKSLAKTSAWAVPSSVCSHSCSLYTTANPSPYFPPYSSGGSSQTPADPNPTDQSRADNGTLRFGKTSGSTIAMGDSGPYVAGVTPHQFNSPVTSTCSRNYIIIINYSTISDSENGATSKAGGFTQFSASDTLVYDGGNTTAIARGNDAIDGTAFNSSGNKGAADSLLPNYAAFLYGKNMNPSVSGSNVITYTVDLWPKSPATSDYDVEILDQITASQGHGKSF